jgi:ATP phosphoribosyltransferase regulatory subunit HisZ
MKKHWRLPRGVDELLPPHAWKLETLRRRVLDVFVNWGFDYIDPPVIEYLDSSQAAKTSICKRLKWWISLVVVSWVYVPI